MKNGSGSPTELPRHFITQRGWRLLGIGALVFAGALVWFGPATLRTEPGLVFLCVYWGAFVLVLLVAFYAVLLDVRYIRLQYALEQRAIFEDTLGSDAFRKALHEAHKAKVQAVDAEAEKDAEE